MWALFYIFCKVIDNDYFKHFINIMIEYDYIPVHIIKSFILCLISKLRFDTNSDITEKSVGKKLYKDYYDYYNFYYSNFNNNINKLYESDIFNILYKHISSNSNKYSECFKSKNEFSIYLIDDSPIMKDDFLTTNIIELTKYFVENIHNFALNESKSTENYEYFDIHNNVFFKNILKKEWNKIKINKKTKKMWSSINKKLDARFITYKQYLESTTKQKYYRMKLKYLNLKNSIQ